MIARIVVGLVVCWVVFAAAVVVVPWGLWFVGLAPSALRWVFDVGAPLAGFSLIGLVVVVLLLGAVTSVSWWLGDRT